MAGTARSCHNNWRQMAGSGEPAITRRWMQGVLERLNEAATIGDRWPDRAIRPCVCNRRGGVVVVVVVVVFVVVVVVVVVVVLIVVLVFDVVVGVVVVVGCW